MRKRQAEIDKAQNRSLALIAGSFLVANIVLLLSFTSIASAQGIETHNQALELAKMLVAPDLDTGFTLSTQQILAASAMITGLAAMAAGCTAFVKQYARSFRQI